MALRPAPSRSNYLGYPSTMGADFIDYIIADPFIAPMEHQRFRREDRAPARLLPGPTTACAKSPNRSRRRRTACPSGAFVFCCFNNTYKISRAGVQRLDAFARQDTRRRAVAPATPTRQRRATCEDMRRRRRRSASAGLRAKLPHPRNIWRRYALADLFLDKLPVQRAHHRERGLVVPGFLSSPARATFSSGVSRQTAAGVRSPELVDGFARCLRDARTAARGGPAPCSALREKLTRERLTPPLFDIDRYASSLEAALRIWCGLTASAAPSTVPVAASLAPQAAGIRSS